MTERGSAICTFASALSARSDASSCLTPRTVNTSATCFPTRIAGLSAAPGFWYTIDTSFARSFRSSGRDNATTSRPAIRISPDRTRPLRGR